MKRRAVILAGGIGSRLRPYTVVMPKPLMPIGEYPILELVIKQLGKNNFDHITLCVNHQANLFRTFFGDGSKWNIKIDYSEEKETLGTMGPLKLINDLPENFLVMNGDILTDLDYSNFYTKHENNKDIFTISSHIREHKVDYGVLNSNENNYLEGFTEKPMQSYLVSMGIYMLSKSVLDYIPNGTFGFDQLMLKLIQSGEHVKVEEFGGYWLDIGRPDDYMQAIDDFESMKKIFI
tara:strand:- start:49 stop:753 length:705 start_codon:yes stop_codon:yes gene_type:complete